MPKSDGYFKPGNNLGRRSGKRQLFTVEGLTKALKAEGRKPTRKNFESHIATRAYENDKVLIAVMKKVYPDLIQQDGGAAVENILISMLRKRAELTSTEPNLIELKALDKPNVEIVEDKQEVK